VSDVVSIAVTLTLSKLTKNCFYIEFFHMGLLGQSATTASPKMTSTMASGNATSFVVRLIKALRFFFLSVQNPVTASSSHGSSNKSEHHLIDKLSICSQ
jgi:hypothetical protein